LVTALFSGLPELVFPEMAPVQLASERLDAPLTPRRAYRPL
jgi:hypothetical protein